MDLAYVCEWERWPKSTHCPSVPLACAWSCRNLIAFTTDLRNDDQGVLPCPPAQPPSPGVPTGDLWVSRSAWEPPLTHVGPFRVFSSITGGGEDPNLTGVQRADALLYLVLGWGRGKTLESLLCDGTGQGMCGPLWLGDLIPSFPDRACYFLAFGSLEVTLLVLVFCLLFK